MAYTVRTEHFEGPLEVLLSLIEKRKMHIGQISLASVTDDFISYVEKAEKFPIGESAHFVLIASTLLLIKSKSLLPTLELSEEEQGSMEDLEKRLREYQKIKALSVGLRKIFGTTPLFSREESSKIVSVFSPDDETKLDSIRAAIRRVLEQIPKVERLPQVVVKKVMSLEEMISRLTERITSNLKTSFREFVGGQGGELEKTNVILSFLALLELVKRGSILASQEHPLEEIQIETTSVGLPKYN